MMTHRRRDAHHLDCGVVLGVAQVVDESPQVIHPDVASTGAVKVAEGQVQGVLSQHLRQAAGVLVTNE